MKSTGYYFLTAAALPGEQYRRGDPPDFSQSFGNIPHKGRTKDNRKLFLVVPEGSILPF